MNDKIWNALYDKIADATAAGELVWYIDQRSWKWWLNASERLSVGSNGVVLFHTFSPSTFPNLEVVLPRATPRLLAALSKKYPIAPEMTQDDVLGSLKEALKGIGR